jgi:GAF domain-containing protein
VVVAEDDEVRAGLAALTQFLVGGSSVADTLQRILDLAADAVPTARYTGLTMLVEDRVETSVFTDPDVVEIDQAQYAVGNGPCLEAFRTGEVFDVRSTAEDTRWPEFSRTAFEHGVRSTLSLPLVAGDASLGALNFYSEHEDGFADEGARRITESFAVQAAVVLANAQAYWDAVALAEGLKEAMRSRATIEQAKGIVIAQSKVDPDTAFELLKRASQRENRKLRDIAQDLVDRCSSGGAT